MVLHIELGKFQKVSTSLVGIVGKPVRVEGSVKLLITLGDRDRKRTETVFQDGENRCTNAIFGTSLLNQLYAFFSFRYLMMKFETNKG